MVSEIVKPGMFTYHGHAHPGASSIEHGLVLNFLNDPNFCRQGGMPVARIHARFERFPTKYASCDTSCHLSAFFNWENSRKDQICRKPKQLGMVRLNGHIRSWKDLGWVSGCRKNMPMVGIHVRFEWISHTIRMLCHVLQFISQFSPRKLKKMQELLKT